MHHFYKQNSLLNQISIDQPMYLFCNVGCGPWATRIGRRCNIIEFISNLFCLFRKANRSRWAMGVNNKRSVGPPGPAQRANPGGSASKDQDIIRRFTWAIASINVHLEELRYFWGKALGISGPQWMILMV